MNINFNLTGMKKTIVMVGCRYIIILSLTACAKKGAAQQVIPPVDTSLVNTSHLDNLYTPVTFPDGVTAAGVYIYSQYPNYTPVDASGEGFACIDDVSRAVLVYIRSSRFSSDTAMQSKTFNLIRFITEMQSANGYFYNFIFANGLINTSGTTSINTP